MAAPAERMKAMRERRQTGGLRELRLVIPDARSRVVRRRIAVAVGRLAQADEHDALAWIESVGLFDERSDTAS